LHPSNFQSKRVVLRGVSSRFPKCAGKNRSSQKGKTEVPKRGTVQKRNKMNGGFFRKAQQRSAHRLLRRSEVLLPRQRRPKRGNPVCPRRTNEKHRRKIIFALLRKRHQIIFLSAPRSSAKTQLKRPRNNDKTHHCFESRKYLQTLCGE